MKYFEVHFRNCIIRLISTIRLSLVKTANSIYPTSLCRKLRTELSRAIFLIKISCHNSPIFFVNMQSVCRIENNFGPVLKCRGRGTVSALCRLLSREAYMLIYSRQIKLVFPAECQAGHSSIPLPISRAIILCKFYAKDETVTTVFLCPISASLFVLQVMSLYHSTTHLWKYT